MHSHRFPDQYSQSVGVASPAPTGQGFMSFPTAFSQGFSGMDCPWQHVYQIAYEQARVVVSPSRLERYQRNTLN